MTGEVAAAPAPSPWRDAVLAAALFAVDPAGTAGVALRACAGPARDRWLVALNGLRSPTVVLRRVPLHVTDNRLLGGLDLVATLRAGKPVAERGILAEADGGVVVLAMAERLPAATVARLAAVRSRPRNRKTRTKARKTRQKRHDGRRDHRTHRPAAGGRGAGGSAGGVAEGRAVASSTGRPGSLENAVHGQAGALRKAKRRGRPAGVRHGDLRGGARLNVIETLRAAVPWQPFRRAARRRGQDQPSTRIEVRREDFRVTRFRHRTQTAGVFDARRRLGIHGGAPAGRVEGGGGIAAGGLLRAPRPGRPDGSCPAAWCKSGVLSPVSAGLGLPVH